MPDRTFRELADNAPVMIWRTDADGRCDWFNKPWLEFVGRPLDQEIRADWLGGVHLGDQEICRSARNAAIADRRPFELTYRRRRADGSWRWLLDKAIQFHRDGEYAGYFGSCIDITEQQEMYENLQRAYSERDGLLREVYHRVKNNLQQIEGLIAMEAGGLKDPLALEAFTALSGRVRAMGLVHQMLINSSDLVHVCARDFVGELCKAIGASAGADHQGVRLDVVADDIQVDLERAVLKGLIINELVVNSLKHAFPADRAGVITVRFGAGPGDASFIEVADNGVGYELSRQAGKSTGLGMRLVYGLVEQLGGVLERSGPPGTSFHIRFPRRAGGKVR